jgi:hypothetical protein
MEQTNIAASPLLRATFAGLAAAMLVLWGLSLGPPIQNWGNPREDGFSYVPAFWTTLTCLPVRALSDRRRDLRPRPAAWARAPGALARLHSTVSGGGVFDLSAGRRLHRSWIAGLG